MTNRYARSFLLSLAAICFSASLAFPLAAAEAAKFRAASANEPVIGRYVVTLATPAGGDDMMTANVLARAYGGRIEPFAAEGFRGFMIVITPSRARTLSADPRVASVHEWQDETEEDALPSVAAPAPAALAVERTSVVTAVAPASMASRPAQPRAEWSNTAELWSSGTISYDGPRWLGSHLRSSVIKTWSSDT